MMKNITLTFTDNVSRAYKDAWQQAYVSIPQNLKDILEKNNARIKVQSVSYEEMKALVEGGDRSDTPPSMCAGYDGTIYFRDDVGPRPGDVGDMVHELAHEIYFNMMHNYPQKAKEWEELWREIYIKADCPDYYKVTSNFLASSGFFLSHYDVKSHHEGFAELVQYMSDQHYVQPVLDSPDIKRKIEFGQNI